MIQKLTFILICLLSLIFTNPVQAQSRKIAAKTATVSPTKKEKQFTRLALKAGVSTSVIYLARNIKDKNNEPGFCGGVIYEANSFVRISTLYTHYQPIDIQPTWLNVKANTYEANLEIMAKFPNKKTLFYPFVGISYNTYTGFFTGQNDYLNLKEYYTVNSIVKNQWFGLNLGTGLEHNFGMLGVFVDYRMRVGKQEKAINIMDVCYTAGLKVKLPYGKLAKTLSHSNDRFHWF